MTKWTTDQLRAINTRERDIIVSASAGTGKTSVMIERICGLLREGYSLSRMLVVTFTNAAALDMKDKLAKRLAEAGLKADTGSADIGTLHGWCKKLINEYFYYTELDPDFEILEGGARYKMFEESLQAVIDAEAESANPVFEELTAALDGRNDEGLKEAVSSVYQHLIIRPEFDIKLSDRDAGDKLKQLFRLKGESLSAAARELHRQTMEAGFTRNAAAAFELIDCAQNLILPVLSPRSKVLGEFDGLNERYKELKEKIKSLIEQAAEAETAGGNPDDFSKLLLNMAKRLEEIYSRKKRAAAVLDFNDLEHFALKILRSPAGEEIRKGYDFVFVDEYQDINPLQNYIIDSVKTAGRLFIVGDLKQSIYAFRGCEPKIFSDKIKAAQSITGDAEVIPLSANHRSRRQILDFANRVFCRIMTVGFGGADYAADGKFFIADSQTNIETSKTPDEETSKANGEDGRVGIYLYQTEDEVKSGIYDLTEDSGKKTHEGARIAALRIAELLDGSVTLKNETRKTEPGDIAVLVRSSGPSVAALIKKLQDIGIKAEASESLRPGGCKEVAALIEYLKLVDNRYDDVALINSLKGRFGRFDDEELAEIRNFYPAAEFYYLAAENYLSAANKSDTANSNKELDKGCATEPAVNFKLQQKLADFYEKLEYYRLLSRRIAVEELIGRIISGFEYFQHTFLSGEASAAALDAFLNSVPAYNAESLTEFLDSLDAVPDLGAAGGAVKIMTVHASKGLEFPFVILLDAHKDFNLADIKKSVILFDDLLGLKRFEQDSGEAKATAEWLLNKYSLQKRQREEEMRLLYVAVTRAKLGLDIIAKGSIGDSCDCGEEFCGDSEACGSWLQWLLPLCLKYAAGAPLEREVETLTQVVNLKPVLAGALKKSFEFVPKKSTLPPKTYVTALLNQEQEEGGERAVYISGADSERAARLGTLYHKAMENLDFNAGFECGWAALSGEIKAETHKDELAAAFDEVGKRLSGYQVYKEQSFIADIPADIAGFNEDGAVLVQGVIDVLALKGNAAVIVDYKTGGIDPKYKKQLKLYAFAAQKILGVEIEALLIYSFREKRLIEIDKL